MRGEQVYSAQSESWDLWHGERKEESYSYGESIHAYDRYSYGKPISVQVEPQWIHKVSYHEDYQEQRYHNEGEESSFFGNPIHAYDTHHYTQPLHVQVEPAESSWSLKSDSYENSSPYDERSEARDLDTSRYAFEQHSYEQPRYVQLEPFKPSWSQHLSYYQAWEEGADPESSYMPNYYKDHGEMTSPKSNWNHSTFEEQSDGSTLFSSPNYAYEKHYYEQPQSIQLEPFKPSWSINNSLNIFEDGIFHKSSWDDESYSKNDDHFFPFQKYSE
nr:unnamed protein product [Ananas comosus var. bracteatus]